MNSKLNPLRVILLTLLTCVILAVIGGVIIYQRDSTLMREGDIAYNGGNYAEALARYRVLQNVYPFQQEAFQKADYCNYNLGKEALENEQWEDAQRYLNEVKSFELESVGKLLQECEAGIEAEKDRARSYDQIFLEDLEKAITLRLDPDDDGDVVSRELMFLRKYENAYFQDEKLRNYALRYLDALRTEKASEEAVYDSEKQVAAHDGTLLQFEVLNGLYHDYDFMAGNVQFVGEYIGNYDDIIAYNKAIHEVYNDMHRQVDPTAVWPATNDFGGTYYHILRNNTPYHLDLEFHYYIYNANRTQYLGEQRFVITDVPPFADYKVLMTENDNQAGVTFYTDWIVNAVKED